MSVKKRKETKAHAKTPKKKPKKIPLKYPERSQEAPPAFLASTGSRHVWIADCASSELGLDRTSLFAEASKGKSPPSFNACRFLYVSPSTLKDEPPEGAAPEVAFLGRSNVGKSSLINAITRTKNLARVSKQPGRTQQVNYFALVPNTMPPEFKPLLHSAAFLIDLPGYGYAKAPQDKVDDWQKNTQEFLLSRRDNGALRQLYLLVDARHGALPFDRTVMGWFDEAGIPYSIVITKADRVSLQNIVKIVNEMCMRYHAQMYGEYSGAQGPFVFVTSAKTYAGIPDLMWALDTDFAYQPTNS